MISIPVSVSHTEEILLNKRVLCEPTDGIENRGRRQISYIDNLMNDMGVDYIKELNTIMSHRDNWKDRVYELELLKQVTTIVSK